MVEYLVELDPWWRSAQLFIRWEKPDCVECWFELLQEQYGVALEMIFLSGKNIRAHHKEAES